MELGIAAIVLLAIILTFGIMIVYSKRKNRQNGDES
jgi:hypothetical protein